MAGRVRGSKKSGVVFKKKPIFVPPSGTGTGGWKRLKIGGAGYISAIDVAPDGSRFIATDVAGGYYWNTTTSVWEQVLTADSMPSSFAIPGYWHGIYANALAHSNPDRAYMMFLGGLFRSDNFKSSSRTWTDISAALATTAGVTGAFPATDSGRGGLPSGIAIYRLFSRKIAVDPINPDHLLVALPRNGLFRTTNGGTSWTKVHSLNTATIGTGTAGTMDPGICGIVFDWRTAAQSGGLTQIAYFTRENNYDLNDAAGGVYRTTNAGAAWTQVGGSALGGPIRCARSCDIDTSGRLYVVENRDKRYAANGTQANDTLTNGIYNRFWEYDVNNATPWFRLPSREDGTGQAMLTNQAYFSVTCDRNPANTNGRVILSSYAGELCESVSANRRSRAAWSAALWYDNNIRLADGDVGWHSWGRDGAQDGATNPQRHIGISEIRIDPDYTNRPNRFYVGEGIGVRKATYTVGQTPTTSDTITWTTESAGIEEMVVNSIATIIGRSKVYITAWDRALWAIDNTAVDTYPPKYVHFVSNATQVFAHGWQAAVASQDPDVVLLTSDDDVNFVNDFSGKSTDQGATWSNFGVSNIEWGGAIAATTRNVIIRVPQTADTGGTPPQWTVNGGTSWNALTTMPGPPTYFYMYPYNYQRCKPVAADYVDAHTFYIYAPADGTYKIVIDPAANSGAGSATPTRRSTTTFWTPGPSSFTLRTTPGFAGHLWLTQGRQEPGGVVNGLPFLRSTNGGTTWSQVPGVVDVYGFGFGAKKDGAQSYPTLYIYGAVNGTNLTDLGMWRSVDAGTTWVKIGDFLPLHWMPIVVDAMGDGTIWGRCYAGLDQSGAVYIDSGDVTEATAVTGGGGGGGGATTLTEPFDSLTAWTPKAYPTTNGYVETDSPAGMTLVGGAMVLTANTTTQSYQNAYRQVTGFVPSSTRNISVAFSGRSNVAALMVVYASRPFNAGSTLLSQTNNTTASGTLSGTFTVPGNGSFYVYLGANDEVAGSVTFDNLSIT